MPWADRVLTVALLAMVPALPVHGQVPSISFWVAGRADFIGMPGPSGSPALFGGDLMLVRRFRESPWEAALGLSASSREKEAYLGRTYGVYSELRYFPRRRVGGAYLLAVLGLANTRVDDDIVLPEFGIVINGGTDATTGVLGSGTGFRFRTLGTEAFVDLQYQWRTNATHGRHAVPLRLGFRW